MLTDGLHLVDGMLLIKIKREIPEEKKPKTLTIEEPLLNGRKSYDDEKKKISRKSYL
jgi:hypothetical protein